MAPDTVYFALRLDGQEHALEAGRDYLLGSAADCDLILKGHGIAPHHLRLRVDGGAVALLALASEPGVLRNGFPVDAARLEPGDAVQVGGTGFSIATDDGNALMVPIPAMRADAARRRELERRSTPPSRPVETEAFADLVAAELRRAPWLGISAALHAVLLLLLWLLWPRSTVAESRIARMAFDVDGPEQVAGSEAPDLAVTSEETPLEPRLPDEPTAPPPVAVAEPEPAREPLAVLRTNPRIALRGPPATSTATTGARGDGTGGGVDGVGSQGFQKTVAQLRKSGLEIVFVFDSTGSMGLTIQDTKDTIAEILEVLRALVPDAAIALVTYRDHGHNESYVVRQMPLGHDFWHAANFVQDVAADGGGDRPEAVRDGLHAAFGQDWTTGSKRVVILAGDAPAHDREWQRLLREVREFAARGGSHVHTLVTSPRDAGVDTHDQFREIARVGKGECLELGRSDHVMQSVLELAFGRQFDGDLAEVRRIVAAGRSETQTWALDLARRGGPDLDAAMKETPVPAALLNALVRLKKGRVASQLIDLLGRPDTPRPARHAAAWALQRMLDLPLAPIDPETDRAPDVRDLVRLRTLAERLPQ